VTSYTVTPATVGGLITAGGYNQMVTLLTSSPLARVAMTGTQGTSATPNTLTAVTWNAETYDPSNMHDNTTNPSRIIIPAGWSGYYSLKANLRFNTVSAATSAQFTVNGTGLVDTFQYSTGASSLTLSTDFFLNAGDYVEVFMQSASATIGLFTFNCSFSVTWIHV
jgi:hypothetical protein